MSVDCFSCITIGLVNSSLAIVGRFYVLAEGGGPELGREKLYSLLPLGVYSGGPQQRRKERPNLERKSNLLLKILIS